MPEIEKNFKKLMLKIGLAMLVFVGVFNVLGVAYFTIDEQIYKLVEDQTAATVISQLLYGFIYAMSFTIPAVILAAITKNDKVPLIKKAVLPKETLLYIVAGIAAILTFAYINSILVGPFVDSDILIDESWRESYDEPYEVILQLITVAVAPGIFEEFMFRGVILAKLRPYGKTPAIIISALMFSLMHQNPAQFLYAFAAGILLGWIATETGSLLCCMLIHFSNNAFSVFEQTALANMPEDVYSLVFYPIELLIFVVGIVSFVILAFIYYRRKKRRENDFSAGMFGRELVLQNEGADFAIPAKRAVKLFFAPTVIVFICVAMVQVIAIILMSLLEIPLI